MHRLLSSALSLAPLLALAGCCGGNSAPQWLDLGELRIGSEEFRLDLTDYVVDDDDDLTFLVATKDDGFIAWIDDGFLHLQAQPAWEGRGEVTITVTDPCDQEAVTTADVVAGEDELPDPPGPCAVTFSYQAQGSPDSVSLAGDFNDWSSSSHPMIPAGNGLWELAVDLEPGPWPYKFVEVTGGSEAWTCDPEASLIQCDEGYKEPSDTSWGHSCQPGVPSCNSMVRVPHCDLPRLEVTSLSIDRQGLGISVNVEFTPGQGGGEAAETVATLDGEPVDGAWTGDGFQVDLTGLSPTRHTLRFQVTDEDGFTSEETYIPFWLDGDGWDGGIMYYAFVDRVSNGDTSIDGSEGATYELASYMGGDFRGLINMLPYLEDLGVTVLWISNPQDNAEGAWSGDCGTYSAYHAYWPDSALGVEEHFGSAEALRELVTEAHSRHMRVVMDWVANHVHQDHPYYLEHGDEWFNDLLLCKVGDDYSNFDLYPETCWFAEYLPDIRYYAPAPLDQMVEDAIWWVKEYELDGFRVDGAKHVPHSVVWNLSGRLDQEVEYRSLGGDEDFYTVGETFTMSMDWINAYIGPHQLDAQFDFPLYFTIRAAFVDATASMADLEAAVMASDAAYGDAVMSAFLGNHDVSRFTSHGAVGSWADSEESACMTADVPEDAWIYDRLRLAWTFLLTRPGIPLIYYGDELGIPGYRDPGNRHPLWWYSSAVNSGAPVGVDDVIQGLHHPHQHGSVLEHVAALGQARRDHPALHRGTESQWWIEDDIWAYARVHGSDEALVVLNRDDGERTITNGLSFAGLSQGTWEDLLTGDQFTSAGDQLSVHVPARGSRVLVRR